MKKIFGLTVLLCAIVALTASKSKKEERFAVDVNKSSIVWKAAKVTGEHEGTLKLSSGFLLLNDNSLKAGSFNIDMRSISVTDLKGESQKNLLNHLKSDSFFAVAANPVSTFEITKVNPVADNQVSVTGNLTIKGITNSISFPAIVKRQKNTVAAIANNIKIDRTKFDIKYRSKSFFGDLGDKAIDDEFELSVNLVAGN